MPDAVDAMLQKSSQKKPIIRIITANQAQNHQRSVLDVVGIHMHSCDACPTKDVICRKYQKRGHFAAMCRTKTVHNVEEDSPTLYRVFLFRTPYKMNETAISGSQKSKLTM